MEEAAIRRLIQQLAQIDKPDFGLSPSMTGMAFAPIPGAESMSMGMLASHGLQHASALVELVRIGPRAIPYLLEALEDSTPTRLTIKLDRHFMMPQFDNEMSGSTANALEQKVLAEKPERRFNLTADSDIPTSYQVTIGDVCFVIIGQIVGRSYLAVRYQPSGIVVINSPTHDSSIVKAVRAIWTSDNPTQHVLDSLLLDYSVGETDAAMRLLYYFPRQMAPVIARRLKSFQVQATPADFKRWEKREMANGVRTRDFIEAVNWCKEPGVRAALRYLFQQTGDPELLLTALPALDAGADWGIIERRFAEQLSQLPNSEDGWYGAGYNILVALRKLGGGRARPLYRQYLRRASAQRCFSVCEALNDTKGEWDREFLWPMLTDRRNSKGYSYPVSNKSDSPRLPVRVCDQAAEVIARHRKEVRFIKVGTRKELDRQIQLLQSKLR